MNQDLMGRIGALAVMVLVAYLIYVSAIAQPIESVEGKKLVPTKSHPVLIAHRSSVDHTIDVTYLPTGDNVRLYESSGEIYTDPPMAADANTGKLSDVPHLDSTKWDVHNSRAVPVLQFNYDIGTYCGFLMGPALADQRSRYDVGLRVSPFRLFETFSPDLLIGREAAGFGISAFPPPELFGHGFEHVGVGCGYVWDYALGNGHIMPYASFSVKF